MTTLKNLLSAILLLASLSAFAQKQPQADAPRKNYVMFHVGLYPTDYGIYNEQGERTDSYRYFGPVFGLTYGRQFNAFLAAEANVFFSFTTRTDLPSALTNINYTNTRYGVNAGLIVTPLGKWFRYAKLGVVLGYVRSDSRSERDENIAIYHRTISSNNFAINYPLRLYALDSKRYALCAEVNLQCQYENGTYHRRTVNYTVNFAYKF